MGFEWKRSTPGVDNVYSKDKPWMDSGKGRYPGEVNFYFPLVSDLGLAFTPLAAAWKQGLVAADGTAHRFGVLSAWADIGHRIATAHDHQTRFIVAQTYRKMVAPACVAVMAEWHDDPSRSNTNAAPANAGELHAAKTLIEGFHTRILDGAEDKAKLADEYAGLWKAAMPGLIKAWIENFREVTQVWKEAGQFLAVKQGVTLPPKVMKIGRAVDEVRRADSIYS